MQSLKDRILREGRVFPGEVLKVDSFLNHQIDTALIDQMADAFYQIFKDRRITKVMTIEASGIAIAYPVARLFNVPLLFAKKAKSSNIDDSFFVSSVVSYTYKRSFDILVSKRYLSPDDSVLLIDDFLATGEALTGLIDLVEQADANVAGAGIAIEKGFQPGGRQLREKGYDIRSLATIVAFEGDRVILKEE